MHHVYARHQGGVYHIFSGPDVMTVSAVVRSLAGNIPALEDILFVTDKVSPTWVRGGRKSSYDFAKAYWGSGMVLDLRANPEPKGNTRGNR